MLSFPSASLSIFLVFLVHSSFSIKEADDYDYVGIAENETPPAAPTEDPSHLHEEMTKLEKYLSKKTESNMILPEPAVRMRLSPHVENVLLNERVQTLWISMRTCMFWIDPRIKWDPSDFDGQTHGFLHTWEVWSPNLQAANDVTPFHSNEQYSRISAKRISDFFYLYKCPGMQTTVECKIDAAAFPHDKQKCEVILEDKLYSKNVDANFAMNQKLDRDIEIEYPFTVFINRTHYGQWLLLNMTYKVMTMDDRNNLGPLSEKKDNDRIVHVITITLQREETFYGPTFLLPGLLFLSISAFCYMYENRWKTLNLLSVNLILLAAFIASSYSRFPLHYSATPRIVAFWQFEVMLTSVQWVLCAVLIMRDSAQQRKGIVTAQVVSSPDDDSFTSLFARFFTLANLFLVLSLLVALILLVPMR